MQFRRFHVHGLLSVTVAGSILAQTCEHYSFQLCLSETTNSLRSSVVAFLQRQTTTSLALLPLCTEIFMKILVGFSDQDTLARIQLHVHLYTSAQTQWYNDIGINLLYLEQKTERQKITGHVTYTVGPLITILVQQRNTHFLDFSCCICIGLSIFNAMQSWKFTSTANYHEFQYLIRFS